MNVTVILTGISYKSSRQLYFGPRTFNLIKKMFICTKSLEDIKKEEGLIIYLINAKN